MIEVIVPLFTARSYFTVLQLYYLDTIFISRAGRPRPSVARDLMQYQLLSDPYRFVLQRHRLRNEPELYTLTGTAIIITILSLGITCTELGRGLTV